MSCLPFARLVETSAAVAATRSRRRKMELVAHLLASLRGDEAHVAACYLSGVLPQGRIGVGQAMVQAHVLPAQATGVAQRATPVREPTLSEVDAALSAVAALRGPGSQAARGEALHALAAPMDTAQRRFLGRLLVGEVRQGALDGVLADAIAHAYELDQALVRRAAMLSGDLPGIARLASLGERDQLAAMRMQLLVPLQPMLAQTAKDLDDALSRIDRAVLECKLDGARVQIHRRDDEVRVFSRQLHDVTGALPELVAWASACVPARFVVEGEAIALREDGRPLPFQVTMKRFGRRLDVAAMRRQIPLSLRLFDCLHLDGDDLIDAPLHRRLTALDMLASAALQVQRSPAGDRARAAGFVDAVLAAGHEGVMVKDLDAAYAAGRRGGAWLKLKPAHTADLVVAGCEWGSGRRAGLLSNLRLAARDGDRYVLVGKTFKGLTDEVLRWQTEQLLPMAVAHDALGIVLPPRIVYEVAFDGVQRSTQYAGGLALRFARYRRRRDDKTPQEATSLAELRALLPPQ